MNDAAKIQDFFQIQKIAVRKWGNPESLCELTAGIKKIISEKNKKSYQSKLLKEEHRVYRLGSTLPVNASDYPNFTLILKREMKSAICEGTLFKGKFNEILAKEAFPDLYISCLKTTIDEISLSMEG